MAEPSENEHATRDADSRGSTSRHGLVVRALVVTAFAIASGVAFIVWGPALREFFGDPERVRVWIHDFGPAGPLVSVALSAGQVIIAPIPGQFVGLVNGFLFGVWRGFALSMVGLVLGSGLAMGLARYFGRPLVDRVFDRETVEKWDRLTHDRGALFFFLVYLFPGLPDDLACFVVGLSGLAIPRMVFLAALGRAPGTFAACWAGAHADELSWPVLVGLAAIVVVLGVVFAKYADRVEARTLRAIDRIEHHEEPRDPS